MGGEAQAGARDAEPGVISRRSIMRRPRLALAAAGGALLLILGAPLGAQRVLQREAPRESGTTVTGAYEGWFTYPDGSHGLLLGYYNRNTQQELDIPIGPNNHIDPGGPDRGQPTHFLVGRQYGLFTIKVPKDFGTEKITWTLVVNGQTTVIPASLHRDYEISPFVSTASVVGLPGEGDTPPILRLVEKGSSAQGPVALSTEKTATVAAPLTLTVWVADDGRIFTNSGAISPAMRNRSPVALRWTKYRGPGSVAFAKDRPEIQKSAECHDQGMVFCGSATTTATFSQPGDYVLHVLATDYSGEGGGGFQCCWTTGQVKVAVK
jgi:hypothetical protein